VTELADTRGRVDPLWHRIRSDRTALLGLAIVTVAVAAAVLAPVLAPYDPDEQILTLRRAGPSPEHLLGMDELGRDLLSRLMYGAGATLPSGIVAFAIGAAIGIPIGLVAGYYGGVLEALLMRSVDAMLAFPSFLLAILIVALLGPTLPNAVVAIGVSSVPTFARLVRGSVLSMKHRDFVLSAVAVGGSDPRIIMRHILPNVAAPIIVLASLSLASSILSVAGLSFLGLGAQPPQAEWGVMLASGRSFLREAPLLTLVPGIAIMLVVLAFNLLGDGIREALDPRLRRV
jgi:ABC-type dipeptide/oligopeptide/nickel transport system permease subunit